VPADQATVAAARGARDEIAVLPLVLQQARALADLRDLPLAVVSAGSGQQAGWLEAQEQLARLSTNSAHRVLTDATHTSVVSGVHAAASTQAILEVVAAIRGGPPLR
jgi:hypothetical protein